MSYLQLKNNQSFKLDEIQYLNPINFFEKVKASMTDNYRMIGLFPIDKTSPYKIITILSDHSTSSICIIGSEFPKDEMVFKSLSDQFPETNYFECELSENHGYRLIGHQHVRPVRKQNKINGSTPYQFYKIDGDEIHEVAVGPIHAGVIEPGHFRFLCHGEKVYNLEINLGYQHRGIENMMTNSHIKKLLSISESIAGDTVIGHTYAHCAAIESLSNTRISLRAQIIRSITEELERIAMHISGLGGVANDIGFAIVSSSYGRLRTLVINSLSELSGSRFGRGLFTYGGLRFDLSGKKIKKIKTNLELVRKDLAKINEFLFSSTGSLVRFEGTGAVSRTLALKYALVGTCARSCGIELDSRIHNPYGAYRYFPISLITLHTGDVFARARIRSLEIEESMRFIFEQLDNLPKEDILFPAGNIAKNSGVISIVEGWRGEIVHSVFTDDNSNIMKYKIKDPSFNNWYGLSLSLNETAISDFPLCNKSFDLSYSGHDL